MGASLDPLPHDLVVHIQRGEIVAFETLFRSMYTPLSQFAAGYVGTAAVAEEVVADVFAWLWEHRASWRPTQSVQSFLYGAVRNRCLNITRNEAVDARQRALALVPPGMGTPLPRPDVVAERENVEQALQAAIDTLSEVQRTILALRWQHSMVWADIAASLGVSPGAAQMQHARALAALRRVLPAYFR